MPVFVNDYEISDRAVDMEMNHHALEDLENAREQAARALVIRRLLLEEAVNQKQIKQDDILHLNSHEVERVIIQLLDDMIRVPEADTGTCKRFYDRDPSRFMDKKTDRLLPFEMVEDHIRLYLEEKSFHSAFTTFVDTLIDQNKVVGMTV